MINKQRVRRIKNIIYAFIVLVFFLPAVLAVALLFRVINLEAAVVNMLRNPSFAVQREESQSSQEQSDADGGFVIPREPGDGSGGSQPLPDGNAGGEASSGQETSAPDSMAANPGQSSASPETAGNGADNESGIGAANTAGNAAAKPGSGVEGGARDPDAYPGLNVSSPAGMDVPNTGAARVLYLVIDATASSENEAILDVLKAHDARATFLVREPQAPLYRRIAEDGHLTGIAIDASSTLGGADACLDGFYRVFQAICAETGAKPWLYRLPDGASSADGNGNTALTRVREELGARGFIEFHQVEWTLDSLPSGPVTADGGDQIKIFFNSGGALTARALDRFLEAYAGDGYVFAGLDAAAM